MQTRSCYKIYPNSCIVIFSPSMFMFNYEIQDKNIRQDILLVTVKRVCTLRWLKILYGSHIKSILLVGKLIKKSLAGAYIMHTIMFLNLVRLLSMCTTSQTLRSTILCLNAMAISPPLMLVVESLDCRGGIKQEYRTE